MMASKVSLECVVWGARGWPRCLTLFVQAFEKVFFVPSERDREYSSSVFYTPAAMCVLIRRGVSTVTLGWVGAPNQRASFRGADAVIWVCRSMSTLRNSLFLAIGKGSRLFFSSVFFRPAPKHF